MSRHRKIRYYIVLILLLIMIFVWFEFFAGNHQGLLKVSFFDVGQGDSIFIETPNQKQILIDGGPDLSVLEKLGKEMSFFDRYIDMLVLTHPDYDHLTGLIEVLNQFEIGCVLIGPEGENNLLKQEWIKKINEKNILVYSARAGQMIELDNEIYLKILWPDATFDNLWQKNINNGSVVGQLVFKDVEFLLTGDIYDKVEDVLIGQEIQSDVLKISHHGSKNSSQENFIEIVRPKIAVISAGRNNRYNHPHQEVLDRLKNVLIYRTDTDGDVKFITDGIGLWIHEILTK